MKLSRTIVFSCLAVLVLASGALAAADDADITQTQKTLRNYDDANGTDAFGDINRHGDDNQATGGPHKLGTEDAEAGSPLDVITDFLFDAVLSLLSVR